MGINNNMPIIKSTDANTFTHENTYVRIREKLKNMITKSPNHSVRETSLNMMKVNDDNHQDKNFCKTIAQKYEDLWGKNRKHMVHYKYVSRPIYKLMGGNENPLLSVPATFIAMDYLFHQIPIHTYKELKSKKQTNLFSFKRCLQPNLAWTILWGDLSLPIAYKKYHKRREQFHRKNPEVNDEHLFEHSIRKVSKKLNQLFSPPREQEKFANEEYNDKDPQLKR